MTDTRDTISEIQDVATDVTFDGVANSRGTQRIVERGLEIISEASRHVPDDLKALASNIPWQQIALIGNLLRHEYWLADTMATWNIIEHSRRLSPSRSSN